MGPLLRKAAVIGLLLALPCTVFAKIHHRFADPDDTSDDSSAPSPTPSHHHRHRHPSPTPSPSASPADDETPSPTPRHKRISPDSDADVTPTPHRKKHYPAVQPDDDSSAARPVTKPTPSPDESDDTNPPYPTPKPHPSIAPNATIDSSQLQEFSHQPEKIRTLIESTLDLTRQNLTYTFSSADPANGGMDCSGFVYYVLTETGLKDVPRDASGQYSWVRKSGNFRAVISRRLDGFELNELRPGDLLFWSGTYKTDRDPPVTHTMIYLGREKDTGNRVMVGSCDGRSYQGLQRWGVSVFDFKPVNPSSPSSTQFIGYGAIPRF